MTRVYKQTERRREQKRASQQKHREKDRARKRVSHLNPERYAQKQVDRQRAYEKRLARARELARVRAGLPASTRPTPTLCECCGLPQKGRSLALDHCHVSGMFRGWVCSPCNTGIGSLGDSIDGLMRAVRYLQRASKQETYMGNFQVNVADQNGVVLFSKEFSTFRDAKSHALSIKGVSNALRNGAARVDITEDDILVDCNDI